MIDGGVDARYGETVPLSLLRDELSQRLDQQRINQRFLAGPVNICTLMPMRSIPFKVVPAGDERRRLSAHPGAAGLRFNEPEAAARRP